MKNIYLIYTALALIFCCCSKEDLGESELGYEDTPKSELDFWLYDTYTAPYNVEVKYRWTDYETDMTMNLVPPLEDKVQPLMDVMNKVWVKCYEEEGGETFIKSYIPKLIYLLGGSGVNPEGTVTQGTAEAGRKIVLYQANSFDPTDGEGINRFFHVMHHEFAHILHQTKVYSTDAYETISKGAYRADWYNIYDSDSIDYLGEGFVSPYAMSARDEDFAEVIAYMLTRTEEEWEAYITQPTADTEKLRAKETIVVEYFSSTWGIDIYDLQARIAESILEIIATPSSRSQAVSEHSGPFVHTHDCIQLCSKHEIIYKN